MILVFFPEIVPMKQCYCC